MKTQKSSSAKTSAGQAKFKTCPVELNPYSTRIHPVKLFTMFNLPYLTWNFHSTRIHPVKSNFYFTGIIFLTILLFGFFGVVGKSQATLIHSENFEDNNKFITYGGSSGYQSLFTNSNVITTLNPHSGVYAIRFNLGTTSALDPLESFETEVNPHANIGLGEPDYGNTSGFDCEDIDTGEIYISLWFKYDIGDLEKMLHSTHKLIYAHNTNYQDNFIVGMHYNGNIDFAVNGDGESGYPYTGEYTPTPSVDIDDGNWHHLGVWVSYGTPNTVNGAVKLWIDEELLVDEESVQVITETNEKVDYFEAPGNWAVTGDVDSIGLQIDDIEIWDGMPTSDTTPPSHPTGLGVS